MIEEQLKEINVVNLDQDNIKMLQETQLPPPNLTQESMCLHNLLLLPHLLAKLTKGEKPLLITPRHIVTFVENLNILRRKAMDNVVVKEILKGR